MSKQNNSILPKLSDYSILSDEELAAEINECLLMIESHTYDFIYHFLIEDYKLRLTKAEQELERRYLLS